MIRDVFSLNLWRYKGASGSSAVCAFTMDQVEKVFNGRYREVNRETQQWYTYNHPVPEPRPGVVSCCLLPPTGQRCELMNNRVTLLVSGNGWNSNSWFLFRTVFLQFLQSYCHIYFYDRRQNFWLSMHSKPCCSAFSVYHRSCQETGHLKLASHARQGAELCQRPLPNGRRHPQSASPAQTQRPLHPDRSGQGPAGGEGLPRAVYRHRYRTTQSYKNQWPTFLLCQYAGIAYKRLAGFPIQHYCNTIIVIINNSMRYHAASCHRLMVKQLN